ncbi:MAG: hypothetical protein ACKVON_16475 [Beijerinckiaceae bacterium]
MWFPVLVGSDIFQAIPKMLEAGAVGLRHLNAVIGELGLDLLGQIAVSIG